jgi:hypothetical protein
VNARQSAVVRHFLAVIIVTVVFIFGLMNLRDALNKSECIREMGVVGQAIMDYRKRTGSLPPQAWLKPLQENAARLAPLMYRAHHVLYDSPPDTIVAYSRQRTYSMIVKSGYVFLQLDGQVKWLDVKRFESLLEKQEQDRLAELARLGIRSAGE